MGRSGVAGIVGRKAPRAIFRQLRARTRATALSVNRNRATDPRPVVLSMAGCMAGFFRMQEKIIQFQG